MASADPATPGAPSGWRLGIDIGGTFTDVVALDESGGAVHLAKISSTPEDPSQSFAAAVRQVVETHGIPVSKIRGVFHGTTVATNAILERRYAEIALVVTRGFREVLECARQTVPGEFGDITWWVKPPRVVPLELVREIGARMDVAGRTVRDVDTDEVRAIGRELAARGVRGIAVSLLHAYRNPAHEEEVKRLLAEVHPDGFVSTSSEILREYREYERTNTTCLNAALMPLVSAYHDRIVERLRELEIAAPFYVMRSSGGLAKSGEISKLPIAAALSGPAAGVIGATRFAAVADAPNVITLDMGGTSADICLVDGGAPRMLTEGKVDIYDLKTPMMDLNTVGAGGGSVAWLAGGRSLRVGPRSAGAAPGPACYGRGGTEPTVSDANLVLGRMTPSLAGGALRLDRERAVRAVETIASGLGLDVTAASEGILRIAVENIAAGVRRVSVERGRDPRDYALVAFGGAGPLHACLLAERLGMTRVIVPPGPGVVSAYGLLLTDVRIDLVQTDVQREDRLDLVRSRRELDALRERVRERLAEEGFAADGMRLDAFADLRYAGQAYEIRVPLDGGAVSHADAVAAAIARFHASHHDLYGYSYEGRELVELVNVGVTGLGVLSRPALPEIPSRTGPSLEPVESAKAYFPGAGAFLECAIHERTALRAGDAIAGPAIVEQYDSTTVIDPGWHATVDRFGNMNLARR
jgi:N-methylhydantoinase A